MKHNPEPVNPNIALHQKWTKELSNKPESDNFTVSQAVQLYTTIEALMNQFAKENYNKRCSKCDTSWSGSNAPWICPTCNFDIRKIK